MINWIYFDNQNNKRMNRISLDIMVPLKLVILGVTLHCFSNNPGLWSYCKKYGTKNLNTHWRHQSETEGNGWNNFDDSYEMQHHCQNSYTIQNSLISTNYRLTVLGITLEELMDTINQQTYLDGRQNSTAEDNMVINDIKLYCFMVMIAFLSVIPYIICLCIFALCVGNLKEFFERSSTRSSELTRQMTTKRYCNEA